MVGTVVMKDPLRLCFVDSLKLLCRLLSVMFNCGRTKLRLEAKFFFKRKFEQTTYFKWTANDKCSQNSNLTMVDFTCLKINMLTEMETNAGNGHCQYGISLVLPPKEYIWVVLNLSTFSVAFWITPSKRFPLSARRLFCLACSCDLWTLWDSSFRKDREEGKGDRTPQNTSKQLSLVFSMLFFCMVALPQLRT